MKLVFNNSLCFNPHDVAVINVVPYELNGTQRANVGLMLYNVPSSIEFDAPLDEAIAFANALISGEDSAGKTKFELPEPVLHPHGPGARAGQQIDDGIDGAD